MGEAMLGLVHPCKIYNILTVGAPVIYIGPRPSHITEILDRLDDEYPSIRVAHGEADMLAELVGLSVVVMEGERSGARYRLAGEK